MTYRPLCLSSLYLLAEYIYVVLRLWSFFFKSLDSRIDSSVLCIVMLNLPMHIWYRIKTIKILNSSYGTINRYTVCIQNRLHIHEYLFIYKYLEVVLFLFNLNGCRMFSVSSVLFVIPLFFVLRACIAW